MAKWRISTWWRDHSPGEVVDAAFSEIGALVDFGYAKPVEDDPVKAEEAEDNVPAPTSDTVA